MDPQRKHWNEQQKLLRQALAKPETHAEAAALFLEQHAAVHAREVSGTSGWVFEEKVWEGLDEAAARRVPPGQEHSIVWCIWHLARIEDATMNVLVAGTAQALDTGGWLVKLGVDVCETGNAMTPGEIAALSEGVDLGALREYRAAVGRRTREVAQALEPGDFRRKAQPKRLQRLLDEGAVVPESHYLIDYWGGLTLAGLLLMPPTRHCFVHLNEMVKLKGKG